MLAPGKQDCKQRRSALHFLQFLDIHFMNDRKGWLSTPSDEGREHPERRRRGRAPIREAESGREGRGRRGCKEGSKVRSQTAGKFRLKESQNDSFSDSSSKFHTAALG